MLRSNSTLQPKSKEYAQMGWWRRMVALGTPESVRC